ncbi:hypothetical protein EOE18_07360 [Novosphingobium umbonatum]|uniref:Uncharacterized protein n=1 Tax=Novosphingobium umbonatum TaxID=1908524 RepID=A0A3S2UTB7_9SPHN|nr:hypothetical protein [Novosphingobium umbonatum]RVU05791.1 hypothetical protein EOE18_07360 [Novosphingobium umbonatum]
MMLSTGLLAAALAACPVTVDRKAEEASPAPPKGVAGEIVAVAEDHVDLRGKDGLLVTVPMTKGWTLSYAQKASVEAIRLGQFIGSANQAMREGRGKANELRVFEAGYQPEYGTHILSGPNATAQTRMTHGFVFAIGQGEGGLLLQIAYPAGCRMLEVPAALPVMVSVAVDRAIARPGVAVSAVLRPDQEGVLRASRLTLPAKP